LENDFLDEGENCEKAGKDWPFKYFLVGPSIFIFNTRRLYSEPSNNGQFLSDQLIKISQ